MAEQGSLPPQAAAVHVERLQPPDASDLALLDPAESARHGRYRNRRHADEFAAARAAVRRILGTYIGVPAARVPLRSHPNAKPFLVDRSLEFSVAHRTGVVAVAVSRKPIGIDVESGRTPHDTSAVYAHALSESERARFAAQTPDQRHGEVLRIWVRKEALLKRHGDGLGLPPARIDIPSVIAADGTLVDIGGSKSRLWDLGLPGELVGAVATAPTVVEIEEFVRLDEG